LTAADEDWLEKSSTEKPLQPADGDSSEDLQQQAPELQAGSTLNEPEEQTAAKRHEPEDASPEMAQPEAGEDEFDSIEIKLDLARAYLAMGDHQAMRILLDEIDDQGNACQREEMASLLQQAQA
jgi:FimV-like protein